MTYCNMQNSRMNTEESAGGIRIGEQIMNYIHSMKEEGQRGESKEEYEARIYAKVQSGKKLTADEMNYLARNNPALYRKALRAQIMRNSLESKLQCCKSKQEAEEVFAAAVSSISEKDPDRDVIIAALNQAYKEFKEAPQYNRLPNTIEEAKQCDGEGNIEIYVNDNGYQEAYVADAANGTFSASA